MINKKAVVLLVIIALVIAGFSIVFTMIGSDDKVSTTNYYNNINTEDSEGGMVGVKVNPPAIEDKDG